MKPIKPQRKIAPRTQRLFNHSKLAVIGMTLVSVGPAVAQPSPNSEPKAIKKSELDKSHYATVNGLKMYYEIHGTGRPLVLLHGSFGNVEGWGSVLPALATNRQVIAVELQGHGHTADRDMPLTFERLAEDTAQLLKQLKIQDADIFGYSMGGTVGLGVAIRYPELVRKLAILGSTAGNPKDTYEPESYKQYQSLPADFAPPMLKEPYDRMAPDPARWPILVQKVKNMGPGFKGYSEIQLKAIKAQVLVMIGDREGVRPEHAVEMFRQIPNAQLAVFPGGDHFMLFLSPEKVLATLVPFLDSNALASSRTPVPKTSR
jgi:pimeloyl-ACP methyl ester carboxylesterase